MYITTLHRDAADVNIALRTYIKIIRMIIEVIVVVVKCIPHKASRRCVFQQYIIFSPSGIRILVSTVTTNVQVAGFAQFKIVGIVGPVIGIAIALFPLEVSVLVVLYR